MSNGSSGLMQSASLPGTLSLEDIMRQQKQQDLYANLLRMGTGMMASGAQGGGIGHGLMAGLSQFQPPKQNSLETYATYQGIQDAQRKRDQEIQQQEAQSKLFGGTDPTTGIEWNQGRPGLLGTPEGHGLFAKAYPKAAEAMATKAMFPGELKSSDLVEINTPEGPRLVKASDALGKTPYDKPPAPDRSLVEVYDPSSPSGTKWVPRAQAIGAPGKPSSSLMEITEYDDQGRPLIRIGGRSGGTMEKKTTQDIEAKLFGTMEGLARLDSVVKDFRPEYQTLGTRGAEAWADLKEKTGLGTVSPEERALMENYTTYRRGGLDNINQTIKEMTGAQMSAQEAKRIRATMPDPSEGIWPKQGPTEFMGTMKGAVRDMRAAQARYAYALRNGLSTDPEDLSRQIPLDKMESLIQERIEEIEASLDPNLNPEVALGIITSRISTEFGLPN